MKKLIIIALLFVGCGTEPEDLDSCVLWKYMGGYRCFEAVWSKEECMGKDLGGFIYHEYVTESCSDYCSVNDACVIMD